MQSQLTLISFILLFFLGNDISATVYTTTSDGNMNNAAIWTPNKPSSPLAAGDEIIINHDVTLNIHFTVYGTMTINSGASLIGGTKKLKIGDGSTIGSLINYGTVNVKELTVAGDGTVENLTAPSLTNHGNLSAHKMFIGDDAGAGILTNNAGATITVGQNLELKNILDNMGALIVNGKLTNHGGTLQGGGETTNCSIEFEANGSRQGSVYAQNICCDFDADIEPNFGLATGPTYLSLDDFIGNHGLIGPDHFIDGVEFYSCGFNAEGNALPVELRDFKVVENDQHFAVLSWITESEINNRHFVIERSVDGESFEALGLVNGAGSTNEVQYYDFVDRMPLPFAYYRLKQFDFDGAVSFSEVEVLEMKSAKPIKVEVFPTVVEQDLTLRFTTMNTRKSILTVTSSFGNVMYEEEVYSTNQLEYRTFDLSKYENGIYHVTLTNGKDYYTTRFVVSKTY